MTWSTRLGITLTGLTKTGMDIVYKLERGKPLIAVVGDLLHQSKAINDPTLCPLFAMVDINAVGALTSILNVKVKRRSKYTTCSCRIDLDFNIKQKHASCPRFRAECFYWIADHFITARSACIRSGRVEMVREFYCSSNAAAGIM